MGMSPTVAKFWENIHFQTFPTGFCSISGIILQQQATKYRYQIGIGHFLLKKDRYQIGW